MARVFGVVTAVVYMYLRNTPNYDSTFLQPVVGGHQRPDEEI